MRENEYEKALDKESVRNFQDQKRESLTKLEPLPEEYFEDSEYRKHRKYLDWLNEERRRKKIELDSRRKHKTKHYTELPKIRKILGQLYKMLALMLEDSSDCRLISQELRSAGSGLKKIALYTLKKHIDVCCKKEIFEGTEIERVKEMRKSLRFLERLYQEVENEKIWMSGKEKDNFEEILNLEY